MTTSITLDDVLRSFKAEISDAGGFTFVDRVHRDGALFQDPQMRALIIPFPIAAELESHARRELPNECCGMLGGRSSRIEAQYPLRNLSTSPLTKYFASPEDLFRAMRQMRESGQELLAIYHSHPRGRPYPSPTDIKLAFYPGVVHIIVGFTPEIEMRGYTIRERMPEPAEIVIEHE